MNKVDSSFIPNLSDYVDIKTYSNKLYKKTIRFEAWIEDELIGLASAYFDKSNYKKVFITNVSVVDQFSKNGIATVLLKMIIAEAKKYSFSVIALEVFEDNSKAIKFYKNNGFIFQSKNNKKHYMTLELDGKGIQNKEQGEIMLRWGTVSPPIVSINTTTYNHANFVRQALDSFLMQETDFPFEILIHDDASTDGTSDIIREYAEKYPDIIKPVFQTENQYSKGIKVSLTYNFPRAKGKYIALCEGDDYWTDPLKLQKQVDFLEHHQKFMACSHNTLILDELTGEQSLIVQGAPAKDIYDIHDFTRGKIYFHTSSYVYRNIFNTINPHRLRNEYVGDWLLSILHAEQGPVKYLNEVMSVYRIHEKGVWSGMTSIERSKKNLKAILFFNKFFSYKYSDDFVSLFTRVSIKFFNENDTDSFFSLFENTDKKDFLEILKYLYKKNTELEKSINKRNHKNADICIKALLKKFLKIIKS